MSFLDILGLTPKAPLPDLSCPECGWAEMIPVRDVVRIDAAGAKRTVGSLVRCAKCASEFSATSGGVYAPKPHAPAQVASEPERRRAPAERTLRDEDMPWDGRRRK